MVLMPGKRLLCDLNMCAGIFVKYGFDKDGLMPYVVYITVRGVLTAGGRGQGAGRKRQVQEIPVQRGIQVHLLCA